MKHSRDGKWRWSMPPLLREVGSTARRCTQCTQTLNSKRTANGSHSLKNRMALES